MLRILVLQGPNLNWLGRREPELYGLLTLDDLHQQLSVAAGTMGVELRFVQSNHEGVLIDALQEAAADARLRADGVLLNPGALAHYSLALADAVRSIRPLPVIEIHLTNTAAREDFRAPAIVGAACVARIEGLGADSYILGLQGLVSRFRRSASTATR